MRADLQSRLQQKIVIVDYHLEQGKALGDLTVDKTSWEDFRFHFWFVHSAKQSHRMTEERRGEREREREIGGRETKTWRQGGLRGRLELELWVVE